MVDRDLNGSITFNWIATVLVATIGGLLGIVISFLLPEKQHIDYVTAAVHTEFEKRINTDESIIKELNSKLSEHIGRHSSFESNSERQDLRIKQIEDDLHNLEEDVNEMKGKLDYHPKKNYR